MSTIHEMVLVIDFGGQYNQLIARRVRENNVYCEIIPYTTDIEKIKSMNPKGIIFTGGPNSAYLEDSPKIAKEIFEKLKDLNIFVRYFAQPGSDNYLRITRGTDEQMDKLISALSEIVG